MQPEKTLVATHIGNGYNHQESENPYQTSKQAS
jgi:hypothetical protein